MLELSTTDLLYLILEFYDRPQRGIADLRGVPHAFHSLMDEDESEFSDMFMLTPTSAENFNLCLQTWAIERRWYNDGIGKGELRISGVPALPNEKQRYQQLVSFLMSMLFSEYCHIGIHSFLLTKLLNFRWMNMPLASKM